MTGLKYQITKVCEYCESIFMAQKSSTKYCSHTCASRAYKKRKRIEKSEEANIGEAIKSESRRLDSIKENIFLTVSQTALLLGVSRQSVYNMISSGLLKAARLTDRMTFIRREHIDEMLTSAYDDSRARPSSEQTLITDLYTIAEIKAKYNVKDAWVFKLIKENNIPKTLKRGKTYVSQKHIDNYFAKRAADPSITEWYSADEIAAKYSMALKTIYGFVYDNKIPKKKEGKHTLYSKEHFDRVRNKEKPAEPTYYTMQEAMDKFDITRDSLCSHIKRHNISKIKVGKYVKIAKQELDDSFNTYILR